MRNESEKAIDGFGRDCDIDIDYDDTIYSELRWGKYKEEQTIYYLHGTLPLFDTGTHITKAEYDSEHYLLQNIKDRISKKEYPIFVTAGTSKDKLTHIMHNKYLSYCYEKLSNIQGSLVTFGFNFGEYDEHIIEAINIAAKMGKKAPKRLWSIYIGVYSNEDLAHIENLVNNQKFKCKVTMYNARTANIWG